MLFLKITRKKTKDHREDPNTQIKNKKEPKKRRVALIQYILNSKSFHSIFRLHYS